MHRHLTPSVFFINRVNINSFCLKLISIDNVHEFRCKIERINLKFFYKYEANIVILVPNYKKNNTLVISYYHFMTMEVNIIWHKNYATPLQCTSRLPHRHWTFNHNTCPNPYLSIVNVFEQLIRETMLGLSG